MLAAVPKLARFRAFAGGRNEDRADDLVQDTLVKAWANASSFAEGTNMRAWLFTILRNTFSAGIPQGRREVQDVDGQARRTPRRLPNSTAGSTSTISARSRPPAAGPARGADSDRRVRLFLRGGRRCLRLRGRHDQEPGPSGARTALESCSPSTAPTCSVRTTRRVLFYRWRARLIAAARFGGCHFFQDGDLGHYRCCGTVKRPPGVLFPLRPWNCYNPLGLALPSSGKGQPLREKKGCLHEEESLVCSQNISRQSG